MTGKIKKFGVIVLVIFFCLTSLVSAAELGGKDPQDTEIKQVLAATVKDLGYKLDFGDIDSWRSDDGSWDYEASGVPESSRMFDIWVFAFSTEQAAASNANFCSDSGYHTATFHGYPGCYTLDESEWWSDELDDFVKEGVYELRFRRIWFRIYASPSSELMHSAEVLYANAVKYGLISGDGTMPVQDSDKDGVPDSKDKCPDTPAGVEVDEDGCPVTKELYLTLSTDKKTYSDGETVVIQGSVSGAQSKILGAKVIIDINNKKLTATTDSSGKYKCEYPLPKKIPQGVYTVRATASKPDYPNISKSISFAVGEINIQLEKNPVNKKPFIGVAADGVSSLRISISLPGCSNVNVSKPDIGKLQGKAISLSGNIKLDSVGKAEITYYPPDYLKKDDLTQSFSMHKWNSKVWAAEVPLIFIYENADGNKKEVKVNIAVCPPPVMLVHGFLGSVATWGKMSSYLHGEKFDTYLGDYGATDQSIEGLSLVLKNDIRKQKVDYANSNIKLAKVDIVGHSMGGLIVRYYTHGLSGYAGDVRKLIMVGTPNHGVSWTKKITGNVGAGWYQTHRIPAGQLYSESSFMKTLNSGEKTGAHLNPDIQYGNIYGYPNDWVVSAASAYLNGVNYVTELDVKHSPDIPVVPKVAITEYLKTWKKVKSWLTQDIYRPPLKGSRVEVYKYEGDVYLDETKLASPTKFDSWHSLRTGKDSTAIVHLTINGRPWGVIFLDPESEIFLGYCSPQLVEVRLWKGRATFRSGKDGHFTVPVNIKRSADGEWWKCNPQAVVTGQGTEFAVTAGENIEVHCLEGELVVDTPNAAEEGPILSANDSVAVKGETITAINPVLKDDFWWSAEDDDFLDSSPVGDLLGKFKDFIEGPFISSISVEVRKITIAASEKLTGLYQMLPDNIRQMMPESISRNLFYIILGFFVLILFLLIKILRGRR